MASRSVLVTGIWPVPGCHWYCQLFLLWPLFYLLPLHAVLIAGVFWLDAPQVLFRSSEQTCPQVNAVIKSPLQSCHVGMWFSSLAGRIDVSTINFLRLQKSGVVIFNFRNKVFWSLTFSLNLSNAFSASSNCSAPIPTLPQLSWALHLKLLLLEFLVELKVKRFVQVLERQFYSIQHHFRAYWPIICSMSSLISIMPACAWLSVLRTARNETQCKQYTKLYQYFHFHTLTSPDFRI